MKDTTMKSRSTEIAQCDIFTSIVTDFHYPTLATSGNIEWRLSSVIGCGSLVKKMIQDEALFDALKKSEGATFKLDKTILGTEICKEHLAGRLFYDWQLHQQTMPPAKYEFAAYSELMALVASRIGISWNLFHNQNPLQIISGDGLRQAELIESFGQRTYEGSKKSAFKTKVALRKRAVASAITKSERYFDRLSENYPLLGNFRFELQYRPEYCFGMPLEETAAHLETFLGMLNDDPDIGKLVGYWWQRRYVPECGYGYHFIQCFDAENAVTTKLLQGVINTWSAATKGKGFLVILSPNDGNYRSWGSGAVSSFMSGSLDQVMPSIRLMLANQQYLQLMPNHKHEHHGKGDSPKAIMREAAKGYLESLQLI